MMSTAINGDGSRSSSVEYAFWMSAVNSRSENQGEVAAP
jgi:hypothetical protein